MCAFVRNLIPTRVKRWRRAVLQQLRPADKAKALFNAGQWGKASTLVDRAVEAGKATEVLLLIKADSLFELHRYEEAARIYSDINARHLGHKGTVGLARCLLQMNDPAQSEKVYAEAKGDPDLPWSPAYLDALQAQEKIRESYFYYRERPVSEAIAKLFGMDDPRTIDLGRMGDKSALLLSEGGPGDEVRLSSIYLDLLPYFKKLCISSDPRLIKIMQRTFPEIDFIPVSRPRGGLGPHAKSRKNVTDKRLHHSVSDQAIAFGQQADFVASILDVLADVRPTLDSFKPHRQRYLAPSADMQSVWRSVIPQNGRPQIGIAWRSMLQSATRSRHYFDVDALAPILAMDADFWILQPQSSETEVTRLRRMGKVRVPDGMDLVDDIEGQLALMSCLDLVISPFTTTGELAAAAGVPTIFMSGSRNTLWRQRADGTDLFAANAHIVFGTKVDDKKSVISAACGKMSEILKANERSRCQLLPER